MSGDESDTGNLVAVAVSQSEAFKRKSKHGDRPVPAQCHSQLDFLFQGKWVFQQWREIKVVEIIVIIDVQPDMVAALEGTSGSRV
jgi:hypothetical protein